LPNYVRLYQLSMSAQEPRITAGLCAPTTDG